MKDRLAEAWRSHLRIALLRTLADLPGYSCNESLLTDMLDDVAGLIASRDQVRGEMAWLAEQGLVTVEEPGGLMIAELSRRGHDVAAGRATHPGVKRPAPR